MRPAQMIFVGGFLGAGKTTLLAQAARRLFNKGKRVGLITNDQAGGLVDTGLLMRQGFDVAEVAGGPLGARFEELVKAADRLMAECQPDVIIAEPAGSSVDLSASVIQPAKRMLGDRYRVAPFSVLTDPIRLLEALLPNVETGFPAAVNYVYRKQLEEADIIVLNKTDLMSNVQLERLCNLVATSFPSASVMEVSAKTGTGVDAWIKRIACDELGGRKVIGIDYDQYAEGEAVLGWCNASLRLEALHALDWNQFGIDLLEKVREACALQHAEIAHAKLLLSTRRSSLVCNVTANASQPYINGGIQEPAPEAELVLNARVYMDARPLRELVTTCVKRLAAQRVKVEVRDLQCFRPQRPVPEYRDSAVVVRKTLTPRVDRAWT